MAAKNRIYYTLIIIFIVILRGYSQTYSLSTIAGSGTGYSGDGGPATAANLFNPMAICTGSRGDFYISDWYNTRIRMVDAAGIISTVSGVGIFGYSGDGGLATSAEIKGPMGICEDDSGNIYFCDIGNSRIRKINTNGVITTIAGNGVYGFSGDNSAATAAELSAPSGICADRNGNIYVADVFNNRIRMISPAGIITTVAGNGFRGYLGDGLAATAASFYYPVAVAADRSGNLYIADADNSRIRQVNNAGMVSTVAGDGVFGSSGDGSPATAAQLGNPSGVWVDNDGNIFIADGLNNRIRKVDTLGIITTIAGTGVAGTTFTSGDAAQALIDNPAGITGDNAGNIYFTNVFNQLVQKLSPVLSLHPGKLSITVYPSPGNGLFTFYVDNFSGPLELSVYDVIGRKIESAELVQSLSTINLERESSGIYFYRITQLNNFPVSDGKIMIIKN